MSKVSITGAKPVLTQVVETVHDLNLVHLTEYDGGWTGFDPGSSTAGAADAAEKLVTVRSLESILEVESSDAGEQRVVTDEGLTDDLATVQAAVNEVEDRREGLRDELRTVTERKEAVEPFVELGIDLDLLGGYDTLQVAVGFGDEASVRERIERADTFDEFDIRATDDTLAAFARPTTDDASLGDLLVGAEFAAVEVPDVEPGTSPMGYVTELDERQQRLEDQLADAEAELAELRDEWGGFLLAAEEELSIRVAKTEAPLSFATTDNAFIAEGWVPSEEYTTLEAALVEAVGDRVEIEELERATFGHQGGVELREEVPPSAVAVDQSGDSDGPDEETEPQTAVADGGTAASPVVMRDDEPPTVQDTPSVADPFGLLTRLVGTPNYREFDPTIILFLTFPLMFGFMVGDVGYGLAYTAIGGYIYSRYDSDAFRAVAGMAVTAGLATVLFGVLYGEIFGTHLVSRLFWEGTLGLSHPPIEKGLSPATREWARTWFVVSVLFGVLHLNLGYVMEFVENIQLHGIAEALKETGSWMLIMNGLYLFVFSTFPGGRQTPAILFETFNGPDAAIDLGFTGFPEIVGILGLAMMGIGFTLLVLGPTYELAEFTKPLSHSLSYVRLGAVLIAKAGLAFAVNLFAFGVYVTGEGTEAEWHFGLPEMKAVGEMSHGHEVTEVVFSGLFHGDILSIILGAVVLVVGNIVVLILGVTSSGIQALRLEYFEFFTKFYEGDGRRYEPLGAIREYTSEK